MKSAYSLSYRNIEELMEERGVKVDHFQLTAVVVYYASKRFVAEIIPDAEE